MSLEQRLTVRISMPNDPKGCWQWTGWMTRHGYGRVKVNRREIAAHRLVYEAHNGPIPPGLDLDHLCRNRACVNPDHLKPVTRRENILRRTAPLQQRLDRKIKMPTDPNGCWEWLGCKTTGYGQVFIDGRQLYAHRVVYERHNGAIPPSLQLDHLCRNRGCVNPQHLEPVTNRTNILRGTSFSARNAAKTHCSRGHPFKGENLYVWRGERLCRTCIRMRDANRRAKRRAA